MRGGERKGAGRKPVPQDEQRVPVTIRVSPRTKAVLDAMKEDSGRSYGHLIDDLIRVL